MTRIPPRARARSSTEVDFQHPTADTDKPRTETGELPDHSFMNVDAIKQLLELVREHELTEFELEQDGLKLRVRKQGHRR